jgi:hypothetical protein
MPDWLPSVLVQFPIVVVIGYVAHYAYNQLKENHDAQQRRDDAIHERMVKLAEDSADRVVAAKESELRHLREDVKVDVAKLTKAVESLTKKLSP